MQEGETAPTQTALTLDAVSRATGSISGGSSSDGSSSGYAISTDFLFKGDLIANACVLNKLNKDTTESTAVLEYWNYSTLHWIPPLTRAIPCITAVQTI